MIENVITYADGVLTALEYFSKNHGLAELVTEGEKTFPAKYCTGGSYKPVSDFSKRNGTTYWRLLNPPTIDESESSLVSNKRIVNVTYNLRLVVAVNKKQLPSDNEYSADNLCRDLAKNLTVNANTLKGTLKARKVEFNVASWETSSAQVFGVEYVEAGQNQLSPKFVYAYIDFNVQIWMNRSCLEDICASVSDCDVLLGSLTNDQLLTCILPSYDFSDTDVQNSTTAQQQTDLTTWLCGAPATRTYLRTPPQIRRENSVQYDVGWHLANGDPWAQFKNEAGLLPVVDSQDPTQLDSGVSNNQNAFGSYERFTNDVGGTVTDGSDGSTPNYLIDHLTGKGYYTAAVFGSGSRDYNGVMTVVASHTIANVPDGGTYGGWRAIEMTDYYETAHNNGNSSYVFTGTSAVWIMNTISATTGIFWRRDRAVWASTNQFDDALLTSTGISTLIVRNHY